MKFNFIGLSIHFYKTKILIGYFINQSKYFVKIELITKSLKIFKMIKMNVQIDKILTNSIFYFFYFYMQLEKLPYQSSPTYDGNQN
jgi:hypothetical protein